MDIKVYYLYFYMHESLCCGDIFIIIFEWMAGFYDVVIQTQMYKVHKIYILCKKVFCWIEVKRNRYGNVLRELFFLKSLLKVTFSGQGAFIITTIVQNYKQRYVETLLKFN